MEEAGQWHRPLLNYLLLCNVTGVRQAQVSQGLVDDFGRQRNVAILHHHLLARLRQHQLDELGFQRGQRLVRRLVDVDVQEARQRVGAIQGVGFVVFNKLAAFFLGQGTVLTLAVL